MDRKTNRNLQDALKDSFNLFVWPLSLSDDQVKDTLAMFLDQITLFNNKLINGDDKALAAFATAFNDTAKGFSGFITKIFMKSTSFKYAIF